VGLAPTNSKTECGNKAGEIEGKSLFSPVVAILVGGSNRLFCFSVSFMMVGTGNRSSFNVFSSFLFVNTNFEQRIWSRFFFTCQSPVSDFCFTSRAKPKTSSAEFEQMIIDVEFRNMKKINLPSEQNFDVWIAQE
jgi:hypothetical protein